VKGTHELVVKGTHELLISADDVYFEECSSRKVRVLFSNIAGDTITGLDEAYFCPSKLLFLNITV
jgi:hypothetical protein